MGIMTGQTLQPEEVVIADDGSTDNTIEIVSDLRKKYGSRIIYASMQENGGTSAAANLAVRSTDCKYITRIDADDMRESWSYESMYPVLINNPHSMIYDDVMIFLQGQRKGKIWSMGDYDFEVLLERNLMHAGIMYSKQAWIDCGGYSEEFRNGRDDWSFNVALGVSGYCGIHVERAGYLYRREQQNRTLTNSSSDHQRNFYNMMRERFKEIYAGRRPMSCCGGRRNDNAPSQNSGSDMSMLVGSAGMTLIAYQGTNLGTETYFGPVTGTGYQFSKIKPVKNVDNRDLSTTKSTGLLDLYNFGKPVFVRYTPSSSPAPEVSPDPVKEVPLKSALPEPEEESITPIEPGTVTGLTGLIIGDLSLNGISTWEKFLATSDEKLAEVCGKSVTWIKKVKKEITSD